MFKIAELVLKHNQTDIFILDVVQLNSNHL